MQELYVATASVEQKSVHIATVAETLTHTQRLWELGQTRTDWFVIAIGTHDTCDKICDEMIEAFALEKRAALMQKPPSLELVPSEK